MQTFKNNSDAFLRSWPKSLEEWQEPNPVIKFSVSRDRIVHKGDRILATTKLINTGQNSGGIANIYYYIEDITTIERNPIHAGSTDIVATAKRMEL